MQCIHSSSKWLKTYIPYLFQNFQETTWKLKIDAYKKLLHKNWYRTDCSCALQSYLPNCIYVTQCRRTTNQSVFRLTKILFLSIPRSITYYSQPSSKNVKETWHLLSQWKQKYTTHFKDHVVKILTFASA